MRLSLCVMLFLVGCGSTNPADTADTAADTSAVASISCAEGPQTVTDLSPDELNTMLETKDFELINVHIPYAGEIVGTDISLPYNDVDAIDAYLGGEKGKKVVLYCLTGPMSAQATAALAERGYCNIYDMPAGLARWQQQGLPSDGGV